MSNKKILLVDDDEAVLDFMQAKLGARFDIISTNSPENVIRLAREHQPDVIVCDVDMPDMDGGDVSSALYADDEVRHIPLVFLTGLASPADLKRVQGQVGGRPAISKTAPLEELMKSIEAMIGRQ
jgi:CheY-like chemotaxis protein